VIIKADNIAWQTSLMKQIGAGCGAQGKRWLISLIKYLTEGSASNAFVVIDWVIFYGTKDGKSVAGRHPRSDYWRLARKAVCLTLKERSVNPLREAR